MPVAAAAPALPICAAPSEAAALPVGGRPQPIVIRLAPLVWTLAAIALLLAGLSLAQDLVRHLLPAAGLPHVWRLDVDAEISVPTWFASSVILLNALLLALVATVRWREGDRLRWHWAALAVIFAGLSLDETAALHNGLSAALSGSLDTSGALYFAWVIPALILCPLGLLAFIPWIGAFAGRERLLVVGSALIFLAGAIGLEMAGAAQVERFGTETLTYRLLASAEEALESTGMLMFLAALLLHLRRCLPRLGLELH